LVHSFKGCLICFELGLPTNLKVIVDGDKIKETFDPTAIIDRPAGMWRYSEFFPAPLGEAVSLGEGLTPPHSSHTAWQATRS
jgi:threonine synthase